MNDRFLTRRIHPEQSLELVPISTACLLHPACADALRQLLKKSS